METESNKGNIEVKKVVCWASPGCHDICGILVTVEDGRIVKISGNRKTVNGTRLFRSCPDRLPYLAKWLYHPDQLMHPLKRVGEQMGKNLMESGIR